MRGKSARAMTRDVARAFRRQPTPAEMVLWSALRREQLDGLHFRRQQPVGRFIADFYCHAARLVVEVDGGIHSESPQVEADQNRDDVFNALGLRVLRISNDEVLTTLPVALTKIRHACTQPRLQPNPALLTTATDSPNDS